MTNWTRPTVLRPQLCDCELVYVLDEDETDSRKRDRSMRLVRADVAVHPEGGKQFLGMRDHYDDVTIRHPEARPVVPDGWDIETYSSDLCEHHRDHAEPHVTVLKEGWFVQDAIAHIAEKLKARPADIGVTATMDTDRVLWLSVEAPDAVKRQIERELGGVRLR